MSHPVPMDPAPTQHAPPRCSSLVIDESDVGVCVPERQAAGRPGADSDTREGGTAPGGAGRTTRALRGVGGAGRQSQSESLPGLDRLPPLSPITSALLLADHTAQAGTASAAPAPAPPTPTPSLLSFSCAAAVAAAAAAGPGQAGP